MSSARLHPLMQQLENSQIFQVHIQEGIVGSKIIDNPRLINRQVFKFLNGREMTPGEAGAALAHFLVYLKIYQQQWPWTLVLEDNARLLPGAERKIAELVGTLRSLQNLTSQPMLIHLNLNNARMIARKSNIQEKINLYEALTILRTSKAYLINYDAAVIALRDGLPLLDEPDWPHWIHEVKFLVTPNDQVTVDRSFPSEIGKRPTPAIARERTSSRIKTAILFCLGIEGIRYKVRTGLQDYFLWVVFDRIYRVAARFYGKAELEHPSVVLLEVPSIQLFRRCLVGRYVRKRRILRSKQDNTFRFLSYDEVTSMIDL